ncbi:MULTISPECIES: hypothetical protein [Pantoea]|jgi:hypothetical protein|uniref:Uncharacterized protein n=1 Tax=Pantoea piersonii TaxID=2364647 RepID=A0AAJ5QFV3_9GAMM|nr:MULTISPECIES: hypothetical protein [Pantoea]RTY60287.1 hypothetical protein EKL29_03420 [Pantoea sp. YU22]WBG89336.1 hypothetical protein N5580_09345 [Pantoea piersonii]WBV19969.1 hypothetical protein PG877_09945 [Pantoea piersonii]HCW98782.1 hypothetical protein [Pantoea sp.]
MNRLQRLIGKWFAEPDKFMRGLTNEDLRYSDQDKLILDVNGNARLNMNNPDVGRAMRARMEELAQKR